MDRVGCQSVKIVLGYLHHTSAREKTRRVSQHFPFRVNGIDAQQFSRQFFGLWRSRTATRSAARFPSATTKLQGGVFAALLTRCPYWADATIPPPAPATPPPSLAAISPSP